MIEVTEQAQEQIHIKFNEHKQSIARLLIAEGCGGGMLTLGLEDEIQPDDEAIAEAGIQFVIDKKLLKKAKQIKIDYSNNGFQIASSLTRGRVCPGCGRPDSLCALRKAP